MTSRPRIRRWFRFSLRGVLVAITILAVLLGFKVEQVRRHQAVLAWIREQRGGVVFDYQSDMQAQLFRAELPGPKWLHTLIGPDFFRTPYKVTLFSGRDLTPLTDLSDLRALTLHSDDVDDLSPLASLHQLTSLTVVSNKVKDLSPLAGLNHLEGLALSGEQISDISPLSRLTSLRELTLISDSVNGLSALQKLTGLQSVLLDAAAVSDAELADLRAALPSCSIQRGNIELRLFYSPFDESPPAGLSGFLDSPDRQRNDDEASDGAASNPPPGSNTDSIPKLENQSVRERMKQLQSFQESHGRGATSHIWLSPDK